MAVLVVAAGSARAQVAAVRAVGLTTDLGVRGVSTLAVGPGNALYLGGDFLDLGTRTGHWVRFDATGVRDAAWPEVAGYSVNAVVPDGAGGWFIGGEFSHVGGQPRGGLAHVHAGGALDPTWAPTVRSGYGDGVSALCVVGDTVYVGGEFSAIDGQRRRNLAAVDAASGAVRPWNPGTDDLVNALAAASGRLYVGGWFTRIAAARREGLAAFDTATGALAEWNPRLGLTP